MIIIIVYIYNIETECGEILVSTESMFCWQQTILHRVKKKTSQITRVVYNPISLAKCFSPLNF